MWESNWLRFLNCPITHRQRNVKSVTCNATVYYVTTREIAPGQELLVYYGGGDYANKLGITKEERKKFKDPLNEWL